MIARRTFLKALPIAAMSTRTAVAKKLPPAKVLFGTKAGGTSKGIYIADWNALTGEVANIALAATVNSPTFLVKYPHASGTLIFCVSEKDKGDGEVVSYLLETGASTLKEVSRQDTGGNGATHLSIHPDGRSVYVANYGGGSVSSFHVRPDGALSPAVSHFQYKGHGPNPARQDKPHAHSAQVSPDGRFLLVNDLGRDSIMLYRVNAATAELVPHEPDHWQAKPGSGPRHIVFDPKDRFVFNINELTSTIDTLAWDAKEGTLKTRSSVYLLPPDYQVEKATAGEITITRNGKFVYANNRGHNSVVALSADKKSGALTVQQITGNGGENTRHIALDPSERWLFACNQNSGNIAVLARDRRSGKLSEARHTYPIDKPMCTLFI